MLTNVSTAPANDGAARLAAALRGDEAAFQDLVEPFRVGLHAHCYRMLGCVQDAEDALQEALLRAWLRLSQFQGRASFSTWLYTIATRTALDVTARRPKRLLPLDYLTGATGAGASGLSSEIAYLEPFPADQIGLGVGLASPEARYELRESVELAFMAAVQHLAPRQRAILLLRDVLGFSAREAADTLGTTVAAANSALERARAAVTPTVSGSEPAGDVACRRRRVRERPRDALYGRIRARRPPGHARAAGGGRQLVDAAGARVVSGPRGNCGVPHGEPVQRSLAAYPDIRKWSGSRRLLHLG
jgi:RNA polymerase sigma factor (sigma-70 family)